MAYEPKNPATGGQGRDDRQQHQGPPDTTATRASQSKAKASQTVERARAAAAEGLGTAAQALHQQAETLPGGPRIASATHSAADALATGAEYMREHDLSEMTEDLLELVKNNPGPALLGAVALGFLVGRAFSR